LENRNNPEFLQINAVPQSAAHVTCHNDNHTVLPKTPHMNGISRGTHTTTHTLLYL
jgi:hypothetical protein